MTDVRRLGLTSGAARRHERMSGILDIVAERGEVTLAELAASFATSQATIRRDLTVLADQGVIARTHGGARGNGPLHERPVGLRDSRHAEAKRRIARAAAASIPSGRVAIALSGGTTTAYVAAELVHRRDLTIVTNSLSVANLTATHPTLRVVLTGGVLRSQSLELVGRLAEGSFDALNIDTAILGADGVTAAGGFTTHDAVEARTNHAMVARARRTIVVADGSKIGGIAAAPMAGTAEIDLLITERGADPSELDALGRAGVRVLLV